MTQPDVVELARTLVRAASPNPPGDERAVAAVVERAAHALGLPAPERIARAPERPNLLIRLEFGAGGRHLVLSGHMDTKPVGDATWNRDPLAAELDGDRLIGLGAADMKAALAAMLTAAARLRRNRPAAGRLTLLFTADEENGAAFGARHVTNSLPLGADGVVIGEPGGIDNDFDRLHLVSRGIARMRIVARGDQGHSSLSDERAARSAGVDAARAVVAIADELRLPVPPNPHGLAGWRATVNTGMAFRGGVGYGVTPGSMAVDTEVRLLPGMDRDTVTDAVDATLQRLRDRAGADLTVTYDDPPADWLPATLVDPGDPLAVAAGQACASVLGRTPDPSVFPGTTDATFFAELQRLPTLPALGPGLLRRAHAADEWVSAEAVRRAVDLYADLAARFCAAQEGRA